VAVAGCPMIEGVEAEVVRPLFLLTEMVATLLDSSEGAGEEAGDLLFDRLDDSGVDRRDDEATESPSFGLDDPPCNEKADRPAKVKPCGKGGFAVDLGAKTAVDAEPDEPEPDGGPGAGNGKDESRGGVFGRWGLLPVILATSDFSGFDGTDHKPKGALGEAG
jgi:hypothetical protein